MQRVHKFKIRNTTNHCRWYEIEPDELLPERPAVTLESGDLMIHKNGCRMVVQDKRGVRWVDVRDGEIYPGDLPDHVLSLQPGKAPAWVTRKVHSKRKVL